MESQALLPADGVSGQAYKSEDIQDWFITHLAQLLEIEPEEVDVEITFDRYGLDSSAAIGMTGDLSEWLGIEVEPTLLYDYPTVESLAEYLAVEMAATMQTGATIRASH